MPLTKSEAKDKKAKKFHIYALLHSLQSVVGDIVNVGRGNQVN